MQMPSTVISVAFGGDDRLKMAKMNISQAISTITKVFETESVGWENSPSWVWVRSAPT